MNVAAEEGCRGFGTTFEGNVNQLDVLLFGNLLHGDVRGGACARRSVGDRAGVGFGSSEELSECLPRTVAADHDAESVSCQTDDVGKIPGGIERSLGHERLSENSDWKLRDRVAVGFRRRRHVRWAEGAAGTGSVLDDDRLAEILFRGGRERPQRDVGGAACSPRDDEGHRSRWIILGPHNPRNGRKRGSTRYQMQKISAGKFHSITSSASASSLGGTSRPSAFAVLRLITSSYFVGACTGRSAGFSPLRMRSTYSAAGR